MANLAHSTFLTLESSMSNFSYPSFFGLSQSDLCAYKSLQARISSSAVCSRRKERVVTFSEALDAIKGFVVRNDKNDAIRALLCGMAWLPEGLGVNIHQLRHLLPKCKSSINGSLQKIGYATTLRRGECCASISRAFPCLRGHTAELRKWSVRRKAVQDLPLPIIAAPRTGGDDLPSLDGADFDFGERIEADSTWELAPRDGSAFQSCYDELWTREIETDIKLT
jgi:hypothetical protein